MTKAVTKLVTIFFLCTMSIGLIAQNFTIQGEVQKADGSAVEGTEVLLTTEIGLQFTEITDVNGFYQHAFDNLLPDSSLVTVSLTDICSGQLLEQYTLAYGNITVDVDFTVCTSNPQDSCMAMFYYEQMDLMNVAFIDASYGNPTQWNWNFGDGNTSTEQNPSHQYAQQGEYIVQLSISGEECISTSEMYVYVGDSIWPPNDSCMAMFYYEQMDLMSLAFMDASYGNPTQWNWNFGDGNTSSEQNPTHQYAQQGEYIVQLSISGEECSSTTEMYVFVGDSIWPPQDSCMAMFYYEQMDLMNVAFMDASYGNPTQWNWNFGDGNTSTEQNPSHQYAQQGEYIVQLSISGEECSSTTEMYVYVGDSIWPPNDSCMAMFYYEQIDLMNVAFMDASYGNPTQWNWNFGDGNTSTEQNPTHQYAQQGEYIVQLSISGEECSSSIIMDVFVGDSIWPPNDSCMAMFTYETNDNLTLMFQDISLGNPTEWQWDFGDGSTSAEQNPTHIYEEEGFYTVLLSINGSECSSTMMMDVFVGEYWWPNECLAMFYPWMDSLNTQTVHFIDESWGAENYFWSFGDGTSSTEQNPSHTYSETGIYEVMLTISSDSCESSFIMEINLDGSWQQENCQAFFFPEMEPGQTIVQFHDMSESIDGINSWSWNFGDGTTSTEQEPLHEYSSGGVYIVNLDITSQNRSTSSFTVELNTETGEYVAFMNYISTATNDLDNAGETCTIYPNPVINNLNININSKDASHARLVIINIAGQIIKSEKCALGIGDNQYSIRTDDLENGVYILQIQYDSGVSTTKRFIK